VGEVPEEPVEAAPVWLAEAEEPEEEEAPEVLPPLLAASSVALRSPQVTLRQMFWPGRSLG